MIVTQHEVEFNIRTLLSLETELNCSLYDILFNSEITPEIQSTINKFGLRFTEIELQEYIQLSDIDKLKVDLTVNASLLDAFGVGKQDDDTDSDAEESNQISAFDTYIKSIMPYVVGVIGLSKMDFYSCTPYELVCIIKAFRTHQEQTYQLQKVAHINAIGLTRSKKFKEIDPFDTKTKKKVRKIDINKKNEELDFLKGR